MQSFQINNIEELEVIAKVMLDDFASARVFLLEGDLGAGKTALVQTVGKLLGVTEPIVSPTFSLVNEYAFDNNGQQTAMYHLDLYRLESLEEALNIGIEDYLYSGRFCFIEWPELIRPLVPEGTVELKIELLPDSSRKIIFL